MTKYIPLNFEWKYIPDFKDDYLKPGFNDDGFKRVNLPHTNIELPYNNFDEKLSQFESCYRKKFVPPSEEEGKRLTVCFEGVMTYARVFVNGLPAAEHKGGYTPFKVDITDLVCFGKENLIAVYVDSRERPEIPPFGFVIDYLAYGGIYREVHLEYRSGLSIGNCKIETSHLDHRKKRVDLNLYLSNHDGRKNSVSAVIKVVRTTDDTDTSVLSGTPGAPGAFDDLSGKLAGTHEISLKLSGNAEQIVSTSFEVEDAELWELDNPNLYNLAIGLSDDHELFDQKTFRFGFRKVELRNEGFFLNGNKIKLRGLNRHQSFPYVGYAMPKSAQYKDAEILKYELGVNTVRLSHYPQSRHFLDRCDELGLLVFDEIPGWQHIGEPGEWRDISLQNVKEMITTDWNRPSIFIWGVRINESQDCDEFYKKTNSLARSLDPTRPTGGVRCITGSNLLEDVYTYNDFNHDGKRRPLLKRSKVAKKAAPYLITEHSGHMLPTKKYDHVNRRAEHALRHIRVLDAMYGSDEIAGAIGWCMFDYNTHNEFGSGDKICYHGVQDLFRISKYAASAYASQVDFRPVMEVANSLANGDADESIRGDVFIFTNCDYIKLYINGSYINTFTPSINLFPNLPHAPVLVNDFVGDLILQNEMFSPRDAVFVKKVLIKAGRGVGNLSVLEKLWAALLLLKYRINLQDMEEIYKKYFGGWGSASTDYKFEGYIGDECRVTVIKSQVFKPSLKLTADSTHLIEDETFDVTRIIIRIVDEHGQDLTYANDVLLLKAEGPFTIIGPTEVALIGGSVGFWIKSTGKSGRGNLTVFSDRFGTITQEIFVEKIDRN